ncbi:MarR family winged helix-turn-helix transcriptional regulator [Cryobacterium sp. PAMC25264]|uniref:MarR family winged helix-turn-helix transcriptional regulator n=1 Tax=Cryobacterium sp. PAMC25264 TaxID=2861288 RepID=UPI0021058A13|nr:MarR family transcriptional regulator [Cryobacterium sp. PAMC25264]
MVARSVVAALEVVTLPQFRVLVVLSTAGTTRMSTLAEKMGVIPSTFSRSIDRMVAGGWVERLPSPHSRREVLIGLTPAGQVLVDDVTDRRRQSIDTILSSLTGDDRDAVKRGLEVFAAAAGETSPSDLLTLGL